MRNLWAGAILLSAFSANGAESVYRDTSPFLYFSTEDGILTSPQINMFSSLISSIDSQLLQANTHTKRICPIHTYVVAVQPGVRFTDFTLKGPKQTLGGWLDGRETAFKSKLAVTQIKNDRTPQDLIDLLSARCSRTPLRVELESAQNLGSNYVEDEPRLIVIDMPPLPTSSAGPHKSVSRAAIFNQNDIRLASALRHLSKRDFTIFYVSTPMTSQDLLVGEQLQYEMDDSQSALHMELKRDHSIMEGAKNNTLPSGPLFERFQFLTPGLFMGFVTILLLLGIGYAGVSALASLQVSYAAFDKENGPQAQPKKGQ